MAGTGAAAARFWLVRCPVCRRTLRTDREPRAVPAHRDPRLPAARCPGAGLATAPQDGRAVHPPARAA